MAPGARDSRDRSPRDRPAARDKSWSNRKSTPANDERRGCRSRSARRSPPRRRSQSYRRSSPHSRGREPRSRSLRPRSHRRSSSRGGGKGKGKKDRCCFYFVASKCHHGDKCLYRHPPEDECKRLYDTFAQQMCHAGNRCDRKDCIYQHPDGRTAARPGGRDARHGSDDRRVHDRSGDRRGRDRSSDRRGREDRSQRRDTYEDNGAREQRDGKGAQGDRQREVYDRDGARYGGRGDYSRGRSSDRRRADCDEYGSSKSRYGDCGEESNDRRRDKVLPPWREDQKRSVERCRDVS